MPTPAYLDLALYIPAGGVNGFELNGYEVNGVGFVDNPFVGSTFALDPFRSILEEDRDDSDVSVILPSILVEDDSASLQRGEDTASPLWAPRVEVEVACERNASGVDEQAPSLEYEVAGISIVPPEYNVCYVYATHPSTTGETRSVSDVDQLPQSVEQDIEDVSVVRPEDRTTKVPR